VRRGGSHEAVVWAAVGETGLPQKELMARCGELGKVGFSKAMSAGWILLDKADGGKVKRKVAAIQDKVRDQLELVSSGRGEEVEERLRAELKRRKLLEEVTEKIYRVKPGVNFSTTVQKVPAEITPEMIQSGAWKDSKFKAYNLSALGVPPGAGHLHPLLKVRAEYRQIFLEMGFTEMPTNNYTESSFWNFDALFQPQQHPARLLLYWLYFGVFGCISVYLAVFRCIWLYFCVFLTAVHCRDAHDTFFISDPAVCEHLPSGYMARVREIHSKGGFGSQGYGYDWSEAESRKNLLRTHTTAVSARMLHQLAQEPEFQPRKYFSIDRVFRNETLDATHLAEFHQIEGVIADRGLTLGDLIGVLHQFFRKLGIERLRFKPAYNPYTEPSMEIFAFHPGRAKYK
jgi:phenylalanyl-tRNA synthetase alpha chain